MPKDARLDSPTSPRTGVSPYACSLRTAEINKPGSCLPPIGDEREWEEVRCPICMEHPHNAVMLICSSKERGCRPFMCDTSRRHSNCLDQFRKPRTSASPFFSHHLQSELVCPLCRGQITGFVVEESARRFMNSKTRCCSLETCEFSGNYMELRSHARLEHPSDHPSMPSPTRLSNWQLLEQQRDMDEALEHQMDFESDWAGFPDWDELGDVDLWSDGNLFNFPIEEISYMENFYEIITNAENQMIQLFSLPSIGTTLASSTLGMIDFESARSEWLPWGLTPVTSSLMSNYHGGDTMIVRSPRYRRENSSANLGSGSSFHRENSSQRSSRGRENNLIFSGSRSGFRRENSNSRSSRSSHHRENNRAISSSRLLNSQRNNSTPSHRRVNNTALSRTRLSSQESNSRRMTSRSSHIRENDSIFSTSRSRLHRENSSTRLNRPAENFSASWRTRR